MKKRTSFLILVAICSMASLWGVPRELVVVEISTQTWNQYCPGAAMGTHDLLENNQQVAIIENHNGDSFANTYSNARNSYYSVSGYPTAYFDGQNAYVGGSDTQSMYNIYLPRVTSRMTVASAYTLNAIAAGTGNNYQIIVHVAKPEADSNTNVVLRASLTQSNIAQTWFNQTEVDDVNRLMLPDQNGTPISLATGGSTDVTLNLTTQASWPLQDLELVIWLQNNSTKEILQGKKYSLQAMLTHNEVTIGTGDQVARVPVDVYWKNSLFECMYYQDELGLVSGSISGVKFYNNFVTDLQNMPTNIWLGTTTQTSFAANAWIPSGQLTQVFNGTINYPAGANTINVTFTTPFNYTGGTLVMLVERVFDTQYYSSSDYFQCQTIGADRALKLYSDSTDFNPAAPPATGATLSGQFPKTTFVYTGQAINNDLACLSVTGNVTPSAQSTWNYVISVKNNGSVPQSTYSVKLMKEGDVEIGSVAGTAIQPHATSTFTIPWTPTATGPTYLYGKVVLTGDEVPQNNNSPQLSVVVQQLGVVTEYSFSSTLSAYAEITGGTVYGTATNDNECFLAIPIGFTFTFNRVAYTTISIATDGFIAMGDDVVSSNISISTSAGTNNVLAAMNRDIKSRGTGSLMSKTTGVAPNRVFTVQWRHYRRVPTITANDDFSFQIQLLENGNKVEFVYGPFTAITSATAAAVQVGLRGGSNADFNNRTTTTDWSATSAGTANNATCTLSATVFPANGLTFTFSPATADDPPLPAQVPSPVNSAINVAIGTNLSWAAGGGIVNGYKVYLGTDNPPTNIVNGTTQTTTTYDPADFSYNTQYFWKIVPYNQSGDAIDCPIWTFSTLLGQIEISTPVFSPPGGLYSNAITVSINPTTVPAGAAIRYTLDGSDPNESSTIYGSPLQVLAGQIVTIRARAYLNGWAPSEIYTANYSTINSWIGTPILAISISGRSVVLSWPVCAGATSYRIEYAYDPYGTYTVLSTTSSLSYTHTNIGNSQTKVFYRVIAVSGRTESAPSEVVGYFKHHCVSGLNMIALPMEIPWSWVSELGSEYQSSVESIYYWDAAVQTWVGATDLGGCWDGDFAIHTNDVLFVSNTSVIDLFFCGTLPAPQAQYSLVPGLNTIMIPLNISSMSMASDLDMDSGLIDFVCQWNNVYQAYDVAVNYGGFWDEDFEIGIGVPLLIYSNYSITWPTRSMDTKRPTDFR